MIAWSLRQINRTNFIHDYLHTACWCAFFKGKWKKGRFRILVTTNQGKNKTLITWQSGSFIGLSHCYLPNGNTRVQHFSNFLFVFFPWRKYNEFDWFMRPVENEKVIFLTCQKASKAVQLNWFLFYNFAKPLRTLCVKIKNCKIPIKY